MNDAAGARSRCHEAIRQHGDCVMHSYCTRRLPGFPGSPSRSFHGRLSRTARGCPRKRTYLSGDERKSDQGRPAGMAVGNQPVRPRTLLWRPRTGRNRDRAPDPAVGIIPCPRSCTLKKTFSHPETRRSKIRIACRHGCSAGRGGWAVPHARPVPRTSVPSRTRALA